MLLPEEFARQFRMLAFNLKDSVLSEAMANPFGTVAREIKDLIIKDASERVLKQTGTDLGLESLLQNGLKIVKGGLTTINEIMRII